MSYIAERRLIRLELNESLKHDSETWSVERAKEMEVAWAAKNSHQMFRLIQLTWQYQDGTNEALKQVNGSSITAIISIFKVTRVIVQTVGGLALYRSPLCSYS